MTLHPYTVLNRDTAWHNHTQETILPINTINDAHLNTVHQAQREDEEIDELNRLDEEVRHE